MEGSGPRDDFVVRHERRNGFTRLLVSGELDLATAPALKEQMALVEAGGAKGVVLDLRDLTFVDAAGLRLFVGAWKRAAANGHRFALVGPTTAVHKLFQITGIDAIFQEADGLRLLEEFESAFGPAPPVEGHPSDA